MKKWITKEGEEISYKDLKDTHLLNILSWIENKAEEGVTLQYGGGGWDVDDMWYEEEYMEGDEVKSHYDYKNLLKEAYRRDLLTDKDYLLKQPF